VNAAAALLLFLIIAPVVGILWVLLIALINDVTK